MNKDDFYARLVEVETAINQKNQTAQQAMADMNVLIGQKIEIQHWLNKLEVVEPVKEAPHIVSDTAEKFDEVSEPEVAVA